MTNVQKSLDANIKSNVEISRKDLPLSCPTPSMTLWNMHPKVYLPIEKTGVADCPYCGTRYKLIAEPEIEI